MDLCLERRKTVAVWAANGTARLLGGDDTLKQTFAPGAQRGTFRASDWLLTRDKLQNMNNRLKRLNDAGALLRDGKTLPPAAVNSSTKPGNTHVRIDQNPQSTAGINYHKSHDQDTVRYVGHLRHGK